MEMHQRMFEQQMNMNNNVNNANNANNGNNQQPNMMPSHLQQMHDETLEQLANMGFIRERAEVALQHIEIPEV